MVEEDNFWSELFLSLTPEEKKLAGLCPLVLKCKEKDVQLVGDLAFTCLANNDEFPYTFRTIAHFIAELFNKRFSKVKWNYMDFYLGNLGFWNPKTKNSSFKKKLKKVEKKYGEKFYTGKKLEDLYL